MTDEAAPEDPARIGDPQRITRRAVFYLPGFDPRDPETYWGLFRREARHTAGRRGRTIAVGEPARAPDGISLDWDVEADGTRTRYSLLRWEDVVRAHFPRPEWRRLTAVPALLWRLARSGYSRNLRREGRRFFTVIWSVHRIYLALAVLSLGLAGLALLLLPPDWRLLGLPAVPVAAYAMLALLTRLTRGKPLYVAHLVDDTAFTHAHAAGRVAEMPARLDAFAARIRAAEGTADEIVVIGHSSSSFLGVEVLDRVLARDPGFGTRGTPVSFVTIGSVIPWIGLDPAATQVRGALARVAGADAIGWLDIRAPWDWLSIHLRDPLAACGVPSPGPDRPAVLRVQIRDLVEPHKVARLSWNLFRMHFQLLMASRQATGFDYVDLVSGPEPVHRVVRGGGWAPPREPASTA